MKEPLMERVAIPFDRGTWKGTRKMGTLTLVSLFFPNLCWGSPLAKPSWNPE